MPGKGFAREHFQPRTCSGKNTSNIGQVKRDSENIVYIDLDSDQFDDVEIIDCPEVVSKKLDASSGPSRDRTLTPQSVISIDDDDDDESDDVNHPGVGELDSDADSNKRFPTASSSARNSVHIDDGDDDDDDCDIYEKGSVLKRQKCEKASVSNIRKSKQAFSSNATERNRYGLYGSEIESSDSDCSDCEVIKREQWEEVSAMRKGRVFNEHASSSGLHRNNYNQREAENRSQKHGKGPLFGPSSSKYVKENQSSFTVKDDVWHGERTARKKDNRCPESKNCNFCNGVTDFSGFKNEPGDKESSKIKEDIQHRERMTRKKDSACPNSENFNFCNGVTGSSSFEKELGDEESKVMSSNQDGHDMQVDNEGSSLNAHDKKVDNDKSLLGSKGDNISEANSNDNSFDARRFNGNESELHTPDADLTTSNEINIINQKEMHKKTDLYNQAAKEELEARQRQLQIQAEEVQILRQRIKDERKKKAVERRQKERVEEVRETGKKEEELMHIKEQLRGEILKGLKELEKKCTDLTSLLRGLGINVGASLRPLPNEVQAAYKRAMIKFHPDRASKDNIREQVDFEEKFKFIKQMKEKFG